MQFSSSLYLALLALGSAASAAELAKGPPADPVHVEKPFGAPPAGENPVVSPPEKKMEPVHDNHSKLAHGKAEPPHGKAEAVHGKAEPPHGKHGKAVLGGAKNPPLVTGVCKKHDEKDTGFCVVAAKTGQKPSRVQACEKKTACKTRGHFCTFGSKKGARKADCSTPRPKKDGREGKKGAHGTEAKLPVDHDKKHGAANEEKLPATKDKTLPAGEEKLPATKDKTLPAAEEMLPAAKDKTLPATEEKLPAAKDKEMLPVANGKIPETINKAPIAV